MILTVYKYPLAIEREQTVRMPLNAEILHVGAQHGLVALWALVTSPADEEERVFSVVGTGHAIELDGEHFLEPIGSVLVADGVHVFHVLEHREFPS